MSTTTEQHTECVFEPAKRVPLLDEVDVILVGCGLSGTFAALAAARRGASVMVIERFGTVGGHLGPGGILAAGLIEWGPEVTVGAGFSQLQAQLMRRIESLGGWVRRESEREGSMDFCREQRGTAAENYPRNAALFSHVAQEMLHEHGARLLLSAYAGDPIVEDGRVRGVYIETKSGRVAVRAQVVLDATGDADLAHRAGAPTIRGVEMRPEWAPLIHGPRSNPEYAIWNEVGLYYLVGGVDWGLFGDLLEAPHTLSEEEAAWEVRTLGRTDGRVPRALIPLLKAAHERGEYHPQPFVAEHIYLGGGLYRNGGHRFRRIGGLASSNMQAFGEVDTGDALAVAKLEADVRAQIHANVAFFRRYVPGFQEAYVLHIAPYMGSRGGRCIAGEYTLTPDDMLAGRRFPDVIYLNYHEAAVAKRLGQAEPRAPYDVPFRILLPQGLDGLLVAGTGAAFLRRGHDPSSMRSKCSMMALGQAAGTAAALCVAAGVGPHGLDVRALQRALLGEGFFLGDDARLRELGLLP